MFPAPNLCISADHFTFFKDLDREEGRKSKSKVVQKKRQTVSIRVKKREFAHPSMIYLLVEKKIKRVGTPFSKAHHLVEKKIKRVGTPIGVTREC